MIWPETEDRWPGRLELVAKLIPKGASVLDLGAGAEGLRLFVERRFCVYTPADLPTFDMNAGRWPSGRWDVAVMIGVLEYAVDPKDALSHVRRLAAAAIVTYAHRRSPKSEGLFRNELTTDQFEAAAWDVGWRKALHVRDWHDDLAGKQAIWRLA